VQEFQKQASQISDDVQALSHDLHASKLQYLGIPWHYSRLSLCSKLPVLSHNSLDSICSTLSATMPRSLRSRFRVEGQLVALHGDGRVLMQSTSQQLSLLPTCKGKVAPADVRRLVGTMRAAQFLGLPQKSYMMMNADAQDRRKL
jgi:hypothetical protein